MDLATSMYLTVLGGHAISAVMQLTQQVEVDLRFIGERNNFSKVLQVWKIPSECVCKKQIA